MPLVRIPYKKTKSPKKTVKAYRKKVMPTTSKKVINKMIDKKIAQNVENKVVGPAVKSDTAMRVQANNASAATLSHYIFAPAGTSTQLLNMVQGYNQSERIGNQIKLKRWIIKGTLCYEPKFSISGNPVFSQGTGYVDLYFGRRMDMSPVPADLANLYENGATVSTPSSQVLERTYRINKDIYKIYWHRRYKIGQSIDDTSGIIAGTNNNDYKLSRDFGFDICKMVCKNRVIKYTDEDATSNSDVPQDQLLKSLTLFATFTQTGANLTANPTGTDSHNSPCTIYASSYAEYEDA